MLRLCKILILIELRMFLIYIIVHPTNVDMPKLKFPRPGEDFGITCTVGKCKYNVLPVLFYNWVKVESHTLTNHILIIIITGLEMEPYLFACRTNKTS